MSNTEKSLKKNSKCICISCFNHYSTRMKNVLDFFRARDYDVRYLTMDYAHFEKRYYRPEIDGIELVHVPPYKRNISLQRLISHHVFARKVFKLLKKYKPDLVFSQFPPNSLVKQLIRYKRSTGVKVILDCYDMWPESFPVGRFEKFLSLPFKFWANLRNRYLKEADTILAVSRVCADSLSRIVPQKNIHVFLPAVDPEKMPDYRFDQTDIVSMVYLGNINHITDIPLMVDFLGRLALKKRVVLHHIGLGANCPELYNLLQNRNVDVVGHGVVFDPEEKRLIYSDCLMGLCLPKKEIHSTMSLKAVEYIGVGLPIVNCAEGDTWDIVERYGCGINVSREASQEAVDFFLGLSGADLERMHHQGVLAYSDLFASQNLDEIILG